MGIDYFPTRTLQWKIAMIEAVGDAMFTGNTVRVQTAPGVTTEFDPKTTNPDQMFERLRTSILEDPDVDTDNPVVQKLLTAQRVRTTRANFNC